MANRVLAIRLVQWFGRVFETQERKKERIHAERRRAKCSHAGFKFESYKWCTNNSGQNSARWFPPPKTVIFRLLSEQVVGIFQIKSTWNRTVFWGLGFENIYQKQGIFKIRRSALLAITCSKYRNNFKTDMSTLRKKYSKDETSSVDKFEQLFSKKNCEK